MPQPKVLCAVDSRDLCQIFAKAIGGQNCQAITVHDGDQALLSCSEHSPDLVILDISLARRDGFEVVEALRARRDGSSPPTPVILLSDSRISPHYQERANSLGVDLLLAKPVALDRLMKEVRILIKQPIESSATGSNLEREIATRDSVARVRPMSGTFAELPFPRLLHQLHGLRASGVLLLTSGRKRKAVQIREGCPIAVKSNLIHECLGNYLIRSGVMTAGQHEESITRMKRGEGLQGQILQAMEILDENAVGSALRGQAREKLFEIFEWKKGKFKFDVGKNLERANALALDTSPANVILEGVRSRYPIAAVDQFLSANLGRYLVVAESPFYRFQEVEFNDDEVALSAQIDGRHPLEKFTAGGESMRRALFGLLVTGMFELQENELSEDRETATQEGLRAESQAYQGDVALRQEIAALANSLEGKDHFEVLGVGRHFSVVAIDKAYSELSRRVHPDRFSRESNSIRELAGEVYRMIGEAYETLRDSARRNNYIVELQLGQCRSDSDEESRQALKAETAFQKGQSQIQKRNYQGALMSFGKALELNFNEGEYHAHYGWSLYLCNPDSSQMVEEAVEHVKRGVELSRGNETSFLFLGRLFKVMGKVKIAEKMFTRAVQIQPECVEAMRELRLINLRREKSRGLFGRLLRR